MFVKTILGSLAAAQAVLAFGAELGCQNVCVSVGGGVGTTPNCGAGQHYWRVKRDGSNSYCFGGYGKNKPLAGTCQGVNNNNKNRPQWFSNDGSDCSWLNGSEIYMDNGETIVINQNGKHYCVSGSPGFASPSHTPGYATCHAT